MFTYLLCILSSFHLLASFPGPFEQASQLCSVERIALFQERLSVACVSCLFQEFRDFVLVEPHLPCVATWDSIL